MADLPATIERLLGSSVNDKSFWHCSLLLQCTHHLINKVAFLHLWSEPPWGQKVTWLYTAVDDLEQIN